VYTKR